MKQFKDFGIEPTTKGFTGDKIKIDRLLNKPVTVIAHKIEDSKYEKGNGKCLHLQVQVDGDMRVVFTGSVTLMDMIQKVPEFPFQTTIVRENERFEFT